MHLSEYTTRMQIFFIPCHSIHPRRLRYPHPSVGPCPRQPRVIIRAPAPALSAHHYSCPHHRRRHPSSVMALSVHRCLWLSCRRHPSPGYASRHRPPTSFSIVRLPAPRSPTLTAHPTYSVEEEGFRDAPVRDGADNLPRRPRPPPYHAHLPPAPLVILLIRKTQRRQGQWACYAGKGMVQWATGDPCWLLDGRTTMVLVDRQRCTTDAGMGGAARANGRSGTYQENSHPSGIFCGWHILKGVRMRL